MVLLRNRSGLALLAALTCTISTLALGDEKPAEGQRIDIWNGKAPFADIAKEKPETWISCNTSTGRGRSMKFFITLVKISAPTEAATSSRAPNRSLSISSMHRARMENNATSVTDPSAVESMAITVSQGTRARAKDF